MMRTTGRFSLDSGYTINVSTLRPSCFMVTHSLWRGDLAMRSRAQGCDHSCAAAVRAVNAIAVSAKMIDVWRFMGYLAWGRLRILLAIACGGKGFCVGIATRGRNGPRRVEKFCLRMNRRKIPRRCAARNDGAGSMLKVMSEETVGGDTLETVR